MIADLQLLQQFDRCLQLGADEYCSLADRVFWTRRDLVQRLLSVCWSEPLLTLSVQSADRKLDAPLVHADISGVDLGLLSIETANAYLAKPDPESLRETALLAGAQVEYLRTDDNWWHSYDPAIKHLRENLALSHARLIIVAIVPDDQKLVWFAEQVDMLREKWTGNWGGDKPLKVYCVPAGDAQAKPVLLEIS